MPKNIRQKSMQSHSIRTLDRDIAFSSRIIKSMTEQYENSKKTKEDKNENSNVTNYAITKLTRVGKRGAKKVGKAIVEGGKKVKDGLI